VRPVQGSSRNPRSGDNTARTRFPHLDGFWSISVYNAAGYFQPNKENAYTLNNITAKRNEDGSVTIQFGGRDGKAPNCLPIMPGWNYMVRLYRPRMEILDGTWKCRMHSR
jgi:hypothetical protein